MCCWWCDRICVSFKRDQGLISVVALRLVMTARLLACPRSKTILEERLLLSEPFGTPVRLSSNGYDSRTSTPHLGCVCFLHREALSAGLGRRVETVRRTCVKACNEAISFFSLELTASLIKALSAEKQHRNEPSLCRFRFIRPLNSSDTITSSKLAPQPP
jgi:hypothetical protein